MTELGGLEGRIAELELLLRACRSSLTVETQSRKRAEYEASRWEGQWRAMKAERDDYASKFMECVAARGELPGVEAELVKCRSELEAYKGQAVKLVAELQGVRAELRKAISSMGSCGADLARCREGRSEADRRIATLEKELQVALEVRAAWVGSWLWGVVPFAILRGRRKEPFIEWIGVQAIPALRKKWALWEFCKRAGLTLLGRDVAKATGRPAGTL